MANDPNKIRISNGYRVIGNNTYNGALDLWYLPTLDFANSFTKQLVQDTGKDVEITKCIGVWKRSSPPVEFVASVDNP